MYTSYIWHGAFYTVIEELDTKKAYKMIEEHNRMKSSFRMVCRKKPLYIF